jgi:hypothetical protein
MKQNLSDLRAELEKMDVSRNIFASLDRLSNKCVPTDNLPDIYNSIVEFKIAAIG